MVNLVSSPEYIIIANEFHDAKFRAAVILEFHKTCFVYGISLRFHPVYNTTSTVLQSHFPEGTEIHHIMIRIPRLQVQIHHIMMLLMPRLQVQSQFTIHRWFPFAEASISYTLFFTHLLYISLHLNLAT